MYPILDACCGSRMFWFDKNDTRVLFADNRTVETELCDGRLLRVSPDVITDFRSMPFPDESFYLVVFDPPHIVNGGENAWLVKKYGKLDKQTWRDDLKKGFSECFRVLKANGILIFKWNEDQIKLREVLNLTKNKPLFGNQRAKTHWVTFIKGGAGNE